MQLNLTFFKTSLSKPHKGQYAPERVGGARATLAKISAIDYYTFMQFKSLITWHIAPYAGAAIACLLLLCLSSGAAFCRQAPEAGQPIYKGRRAVEDHRKAELPKKSLGMVEAVERALAHNPSLGSQEAQSMASGEARKSSRGAFGPKLGSTYSVIKQERKTDPQGTPAAEYGVYSWGIEVSQPVFQGFRLLANYQKAALQEESDRAAVRNAELSLTEQVQTGFLACLQADEDVKSESDALERLRDQLRITRAFHEVGLRPRLDVLQAEVDVSQAENLLIQAENRRDTSYANLNTLLGYPAAAKISYHGQLKYVPFRLTLEECLKNAYSKRPDLFMASKSVEMARKDQMLARSGYFPQIEAYYNINQTGNSPDLQMRGNHGSRSATWEVGMRASWDVFQWGVTYYDDKRAGWLVTRMRQEEESLKLTVGYEIKSRLLAVREAEKRIAVAEKGVEQARESYEAALARYQEQVGTNFDVLNASSNLTRAEASLISSRADYLTALAQIYAAMGEYHPDLLKS